MGTVTAKLPTLQSNAYWPLLQYDWNTWLNTRVKRAFDVVVAAVALVLLAPLFAAIAVAIKLDSPGPVIFRQQRVRGNQPADIEHPEENTFTFFKFRSMVANADAKVHQKYVQALISGQAARQGKGLYKLTQDKRITRVGAFLRRTSIDELPQLFNVLRGDMSLVGPRPALPYEVSVYKPWHCVRLSVTPGLTGLWQVEGRNKLTFDEMVRFDVTYARRHSLAMDASILIRTLPAVIGGTGA
jgi:lipopolysaccharide/colanic/teichoic acid biosynthesis glycosyltransferase